MNRKFIDRMNEIKILDECWKSEKFEFTAILGRRRIGKTEIIKEFIKDKPAIYFLCSDRKPLYNLKKFSEKVCEFTGLPPVSFKNFQDAFEALLAHIKKEKIVVAIDEFGYLVRKDSGVLSDFQEIVDDMLKDKKAMLILCGSSISMMETAVLGHGSPLYGRTTRYLKIEPFDFPAMRAWYPEANIEELVKIYAVTSGVAKYLEFFTGRTVEKEIARNFFDSSSFMFGDATRLLSDELRDYSTYIQVLEGIALGYNRVNEIANYAFVQPKDVFFYLKVLASLGIVKRDTPVFAPRKSKRGIYRIDDNYFNFWFRFVSPFQSEIEIGALDAPVKNFEAQFNAYLGGIFEKISHQFLYRAKLPFVITKMGRWWHKDREIDVIAVNTQGREVAFFEVKWKALSKNEAVEILEELKEKSKSVEYKRRKEYFGLIAKMIEDKRDLRGYLVFDMEDFGEVFQL